jgi:hypothetical protein
VTDIAATFQETNEALSENRRELAEEIAKIHTEPDLSKEAKARYVGDATERAQAKYAEKSALLKTQDALRGAPGASWCPRGGGGGTSRGAH